MKYYFNVYLDDDSTMKYIPNELNSDKKDELIFFDLFVSCFSDTYKFYNRIEKDLNLTDRFIKKVTIDYKRTKKSENLSAFSIINNNPYIKEVLKVDNNHFSYIRKKEIYGSKNYKRKVVSISSNCLDYTKMREYLFEEIGKQEEKFLEDIYTYNNDFSKLLLRYIILRKQRIDSLEDNNVLLEIKDKILEELSNYKTFRGLALRRYYYEKKGYKFDKISDKPNNKEVPPKKEIIDIDSIDTTSEVIEDLESYNSKHDEYLEPDEFKQMIYYNGK